MMPKDLLMEWLAARMTPAGLAWLREKSSLLASGAPDRVVFTAFSTALRFSGKAPLDLGPAELARASASAPEWNPQDWTCDQAARVLLLLSLPADAQAAQQIERIYQTADVGEAVTLQKALAVLPNPLSHMSWARDGIRSNIQEVFEAIAIRNPYPARHFDDIGWNQMAVKTFFVGVPLSEVMGLDRRVNADLSRMLVDLAHERWAAGRDFSPQLWRCVGPRADERALSDLENLLANGQPESRRAAALALHACPVDAAATILASDPVLASAVRQGNLTWENFQHGS